MSINQIPQPQGATTPRLQLFKATGSWVAPEGVTVAIAHIVSGGGGSMLAGAGGASSAFGINGVLAKNGTKNAGAPPTFSGATGRSASANTGAGGCAPAHVSGSGGGPFSKGETAKTTTVSVTVTPGTSYPITIGAGGAGGTVSGKAGGGAGGSGFVAIEWWS